MKLNISDFTCENEILSTNEFGLIRNDPKPVIEEEWDKLGGYYTLKSLEDKKSEVSEFEFHNSLAFSRLENENALAIGDLCNQKILKEFEQTEFYEESGNIKIFIANQLFQIISNRYEELKRNIADENEAYQKIKALKYESKIMEGQLRIYITPTEFIDNGKELEQDDQQVGLCCRIRIKGMEFAGCYKTESKNKFEEKKIKLSEAKIVGKYEYGNITVEISKDIVDLENEICTAVICELLGGSDPKDVMSKLPIYFSRFYLGKLIEKSKNIKLVQTSTKICCDGLSSIFYIKSDYCVYKVKRDDLDFEIFSNGRMIKLDTVCI